MPFDPQNWATVVDEYMESLLTQGVAARTLSRVENHHLQHSIQVDKQEAALRQMATETPSLARLLPCGAHCEMEAAAELAAATAERLVRERVSRHSSPQGNANQPTHATTPSQLGDHDDQVNPAEAELAARMAALKGCAGVAQKVRSAGTLAAVSFSSDG